MHKITVDPSHRVVESRLAGFLNLADVAAYATEVEPLIHRCAAAGPYRMLIDVSDCRIQPQEVVAAFQQHVARVPVAQRLAVVTGSSIIRMQVNRVMKGPGMAIFDTRVAALAWLNKAKAVAAYD